MLKVILYGIVFYFIFSVMKKIIFGSNARMEVKKNQSYKNLDIKDADFEDINND
jgi:hypothetical protein|tara:strand:+ start:200 stop:361 length:162 start_codon:yes stop_codon:yes gene_type:complete